MVPSTTHLRPRLSPAPGVEAAAARPTAADRPLDTYTAAGYSLAPALPGLAHVLGQAAVPMKWLPRTDGGRRG